MRASRGPLDIDTGVVRRDRFLLQQTPVSHLFVGFGRRAVLIDRISEAETALKSGYDPGEGRDDNGRWTAGGGIPSPAIAAASLAPAMSATSAAGDAVLAGEAGGFLVAAAPAGLAALSEFLLPLAAVGAVVVLGYLAIRRREDETSTGTVMNRPDINYEYDPNSRYVILSDSSGSPIFSGAIDEDGFVRDPDGVKVGREIDGSVIIDDDILPSAVETVSDTAARGAQARAVAAADTAEPQVCPEPTPDRNGWKSLRSIAYQNYINILVNPEAPLEPGLAVRLINPATGRYVTFDDCYRMIGTMVEAKGPGYGDMFRKNNAKLTAGLDAYLLRQAARQVSAAGLRPMEWDFADENAAAHAKILFDRAWGAGRIDVEYRPFPGTGKSC